MDRKLIDEHKQRLKESLKFFSNDMKPERERWVCREFLENLGIKVLDRELVSSKEDPPDVLFRSARFEVKELMDEDRPRMAEYKKSLAKAETATDAEELLEHYEPKTMSASDVRDLVLPQVQELEKKYPRAVRESLDLIFYVNLLDYATTGSTVDVSQLPKSVTEWRSVSFVTNNCSCVIWVANKVPDFLAGKVGSVFHKNPSRPGMTGIPRYFLAITAGFILMFPLGALFTSINWPIFHGWGLVHGSFLIAWPFLTWLVLRLGSWLEKIRAYLA